MKKWFKLDNAAKIYPPTQKRNWAFMFRLSVTLTEEIDEDILRQAQENILRRFPSFACRLRRGLFWYYLEQMDGAPPICKDIHNPMQKINVVANKHFQYRILYLKNRIAVEFFHVLTDGTGGLTFLMSLVAEYLRIAKGHEVEVGQYILSCSDKPQPLEYEDSFLRYAGDETIGRAENKSYQLKGKSVAFNKLLIISGKAPTDKLKEKAKEYGVSVGAFLAALLLQAVYKKQQTEKRKAVRKKDVKVAIPVNLRRIFPSSTMRNFSFFINTGISSRLGEYTFEEILSRVRCSMEMNITDKELRGRFSHNVSTEKKIGIRILPLFIKAPVMKLIYHIEGHCYNSSTVSNLGIVTVPEYMETYIDRIDFILGRSPEHRTNLACVSFKDQTIMNFSRSMVDADVERYFFTSLVEMGIPVSIESNGR